MGKSAPAPQAQQVTQTSTNLPEYARPYFENVTNRAQAESYQPYTGYGADRIAGFTPAQQQVQQNVLGLSAPNQFGAGSSLAYQAGLGALGQQTFGNEQAQQYMSPYIQQALEPQMREAVTGARRAQVAQDLGSARQGTYGGSRQALASLERERNLGQQLGDIQARGLQSAYENAQTQFERDRAARNTGLQTAGQMSQTLGNLGQYQQQADIQRLGAQGAAAQEQRGLQQQYLDQDYADFLRQRDYPMERLGQFSNILRGLPVGLSTTNTTYATPPSMSSQVLGGGLGALGLARTLGG
jgi:hypothetical protein